MVSENNFVFLVQELWDEWRRKMQFNQQISYPNLNLGIEYFHQYLQVKLLSSNNWLQIQIFIFTFADLYRFRHVVEN